VLNWEVLSQSLFFALQFVVLNKDLGGNGAPSGWVLGCLTLMQFAIPLVASTAFIGHLFRDQIGPFLVSRQVAKLDRHHVIVGFGEIGQALASKLLKGGKAVVAIDNQRPIANPEERLFTLGTDARQTGLFDGIGIERAECIYLMLPDERINLAALDSLVKLDLKQAPKVYVRAETESLKRLFSDWVGLKSWCGTGDLDIRLVDPYDIVARGIVNRYSPDRYVPTDKEAAVSQTVMIVGVSALAKALVVRFARLGIYSEQGKLRLLWVGEGAVEAFQELAAIYPALDPGSHALEFWGADSDAPDFGFGGEARKYFDLLLPPIVMDVRSQPAAHLVGDGCFGPTLPAAIYVCHDSDVRNLAEARDLQAALSTCKDAFGRERLILALQNHSLLGMAGTSDMSYKIDELGLDDFFAETLVTDRADGLAMKYRAVYHGSKVDPAEWKTEKFLLKESNRDLADHLAIKARYAGIGVPQVDSVVFDGEVGQADFGAKLEAVAADLVIMEQRRYRAFMHMSGFRHGQVGVDCAKKEVKNLERCQRINGTLLERTLPADELAKDNNIIEVSIRAMSLATDAAAVVDRFVPP